MKYLDVALFFTLIISTIQGVAQPYVVNEKVEKIFSEGFTDINKSFIITPSSDPKFWATYGDGYYYMQRKIASPRAVIANADPITKNFYIKSKILLNHLGPIESSVGIIFLAQKGGKGGFVFEFNKRKKFRIKDLGTGAFITKEGENGWIKSKGIAPAPRNNTVEIKGFRGKFDIYINGAYIYSFVNSSYSGGKFGAYIGPNTEAKIYYYNVYNLDMPGAEPEVNLKSLSSQIEALKLENDSLRTVALTAVYGDSDKTAISAIKILEKQLQFVNEENSKLKNALENSSTIDSSNFKKPNQFIELSGQLKSLKTERDSLSEAFSFIKNELTKSYATNDSLDKEILNNKTEIEFVREQLSKLKLEIAETKLGEKNDSLVKIEKKIDESVALKNKEIGDSISDLIFKEKTVEKPDSVSKTERTPSVPSKIAAFPKTSEMIDSISNKIIEKTDSAVVFQPTPSTPSKIAAFPKIAEDQDSNHYQSENKIDSTALIDRAPSVPSKMATLPKMPETSNSSSLEIIKNRDTDSLTTKDTSYSTPIKIDNSAIESLETDSLENQTSVQPGDQTSTDLPMDTVGEIEIIKKDSVYMHTIDIDDQFDTEEIEQENTSITDSVNTSEPEIKKKKNKARKAKKEKKAATKD